MATKIDAKYLKSNFDYDIKEELRGEVMSSSGALMTIFNGIYDEVFSLVKSEDVTVTCLSDMEARLDTEEKQDWFRKAQCYQLIYNMRTGKNTMFIPDTFSLDDKSYDWCRDTLRIMRNILGFNRPTIFTER